MACCSVCGPRSSSSRCFVSRGRCSGSGTTRTSRVTGWISCAGPTRRLPSSAELRRPDSTIADGITPAGRCCFTRAHRRSTPQHGRQASHSWPLRSTARGCNGNAALTPQHARARSPASGCYGCHCRSTSIQSRTAPCLSSFRSYGRTPTTTRATAWRCSQHLRSVVRSRQSDSISGCVRRPPDGRACALVSGSPQRCCSASPIASR